MNWWSYLIIAGHGGEIIYDPRPSLFYRQHQGSLVGTNKSWRGRLLRLFKLIKGDFRFNMQNNINSLSIEKDKFNEENRLVLETLSRARNSSFIKRSYLYIKSGVYRQNLIGDFIFFIFFIFKRI